MVGATAPGTPALDRPRRIRLGRVLSIREVATLAGATGLAVVVVRDGTSGWQAARFVAVIAGAIGAIVVPRFAPAARLVEELVLGAVAVAVGIGIGGPHVVKAGATLLSASGVVVLVAGLVLFACGLRDLLRGSSRWVRLPARAAALLLPVLLSWTLGQAVAATNVPRPELDSRTPSDVGLRYRDVEFDATDGVTLSGWYTPSRNGAAIVLLHGAGSTRSNVLDHAAVLARHGFGVLLFDARGHGRSDGRAMDFGWFGDSDIGGAVVFLQRQPDVERIGAVGLSMGGEEAIGAAAGVSAIRVVVAEGATNRVAGDKAWLSDEFGARGALSEVIDGLTFQFADLLTSARPPITLHDAARAAARPTLLIAAGDVADESSAARYIQSASPDTVDLWVVPGTGHTRALATHPDEWEARVVGFLDDAFGADEGSSKASNAGDGTLPPVRCGCRAGER